MSLTPTVVVNLTRTEERERERLAIAGGRALAELARRQYGVVARHQLLGLGLGRGAIDWRLRSSRLRSIHRGVYAVAPTPLSQRGYWLAAVLACGEQACLSHASAAALWGLGRQRGPVDVISTGRPGRRGIRLHRSKLDPVDRVNPGGIPVTTVARTLFDLAEAMDEDRLKRAWEEADRLRLLRLRAIADVCARNPGRRATRRIAHLLAEARAVTRTRSPLEDRFQGFVQRYELPPPTTNVLVLDREVDVLWPDARLIVELDSWEFHRHRAAFQRDRARDTRLLVAGYRTVRVTHDRLDTEPTQLAQDLHQLLRGQTPPAEGSR